MLPPENCSVTKLANETGIHKSTLSTWESKSLKGQPARECGRPKDILSSREKFMIVMETYTLSEIELSKYCREHGLYVEDVKRWRNSCIEANTVKKTDTISPLELKEEYQSVLNIVKKSEFANLPPSQIVPALADRGMNMSFLRKNNSALSVVKSFIKCVKKSERNF